ncbi:MAG: hypothetical protein LBP93_06000 [Treponema sp.]|jgi:hypothetical protein|nr:hypothetical protein [Treponema sp.]
MKRILLFVIVLGIVFSGLVFAADGYEVQRVDGKVEREVSPGKWEAVSVGAVLTPAAVINTGLNSTLVLKAGEKTFTIKAMQKGTVENLTSAGGSGAGIRIGGRVSDSNTTTTARGTSNISTASTRASDAAEDLEWVEE